MFPPTPLSDISFTFINDGIDQENNETFQLRFDTIPSTAARQISGEPFAIQDTLSATIIDSDGEFISMPCCLYKHFSQKLSHLHSRRILIELLRDYMISQKLQLL